LLRSMANKTPNSWLIFWTRSATMSVQHKSLCLQDLPLSRCTHSCLMHFIEIDQKSYLFNIMNSYLKLKTQSYNSNRSQNRLTVN
jgi:hypothetical protein